MAKTSKLRHTVGTVGKQPLVDISPSGAIWDCGNSMACNSSYLAVATADRGVTIVAPDTTGKMKPGVPIIQNPHAGAVLDLAFNPFASDVLFTAGEDGNVRGWRIPEGGLTANMTSEHALTTLSAHSKKVGVMSWHPSTAGVLATVGMDHIVNIWDVESKTIKVTAKQAEQQTSFNWNIDGTLFNTTSRDKNLYVFDARTGAIAGQAQSHRGAKVQRSVWAKRRDLIVTLGFDQQQHRELKVWDPRNLASALHTEEIDQQSAVMAPFIDEDTGLLFFSGKGDVEIQYYDLWREATPIVRVGAYLSSEPVRGLCMAPKLAMRLKDCEVARFHVAHSKTMTTASFTVPRRQGLTQFQADLYPSTFASVPALTAPDYFAGKASAPLETDYSATFEGGVAVTSGAASVTAAASSPAPAPAPVAAAAPPAVAATPEPVPEPVAATPEPVAATPEPVTEAAEAAEEPKKEEPAEETTNKKDEEPASKVTGGDDEETEAKRIKLAALKVDVEAQQALVEKLRVELAAAEAQHAATVAQIASLSQ